MSQTEMHGRTGHIAIYAAMVLAIIPALLVFFYVEKVPAILIPILAAALPLFSRSRAQAKVLRLVALVLLSVVALLGMMSIGRLFIPSALAMAVACAQKQRTSVTKESTV